ncbi:MAG: phosphotransferase, partial [Actinomycetota bacterium]
MSIAGAEVGRPTSIDEVDAAWLTAVLRTSGTLGSDGEVGGVSVEPFAEGVGFLSLLHRATLTYDGPADGAPATVIIKMVTDLESQRGIADALQFYQRELRFYREIAAGLEFRTPVVHAAVIAEDSTDFVLVMEDLSELRGLDQTAGVGEDDAMLSVWSMAGLHAHFWGQDLADLETTFLPFDNPIYRAALPAVFAGGWETCKAVAADLLDPEVVAYGDRFAELVPFFIEEIYREPTLIHGDWRADNLLVDDNG